MTVGEPGRGPAAEAAAAPADPRGRAAGLLVGDAARLAAVGRIAPTAVGLRALQRLADLAARLLGADSAQVSLLGEVQTIAGGVGLPPGAVGSRSPLAQSLCTVTAVGADAPLVIADAVRDDRVAHLPPVVDGRVGGYLGVPLVTADGHVVGALCVFGREPRQWSDEDVALLGVLGESVATELELSALSTEFEASRLRFGLAIDAAGIGSFDWDLITGTLTWDDRLIELFGYDRATFDQTIESFNARLHPDDVARTAEAIQTAIDTCAALEIEYRVVLPTGETRWMIGRGRALADGGGNAVRLLGVSYDTTRQRDGDARVARVLESMSAAFYSLTRDWAFDYVNAEAERLLGRSREELLGGSIWELFPATVGGIFEERYRGAMSSGEPVVFEAYYPPPLDGWYEIRAWPSPDGLSVYFLETTERRLAQERIERSTARLAVIATVSAHFTDALTAGAGGAEAALQGLAEAVVPVLGDWSLISLVEEDGRLRDVASWHRDPGQRPRTARYLQARAAGLQPVDPVLSALAAGKVIVAPDVRAALERAGSLPLGEAAELFDALDPQSVVALPLMARGRMVGAISIYRAAGRAPMDDQDLTTAREVADRAGLAVDSARLHEQQRHLAERLQRSLLTEPPQPDHGEIVVRYQPAVEVAEVGGDWYDAFMQPGGATMLVIGDVVGHDAEAAAAMGQLRGLLRGIAFREGVGPAGVLRDLDLAIRGLEINAMATAAVVRVEQTAEEKIAGLTRLRWSNAGHPPLIVVHADGRIEQLAGERADLMLGVEPSFARRESVITLARGATVLLYTDGLVEGRDLPLDDGIARLVTALAELADRPLEDLCDEVIDRLRPGGSEDDVALVAIRLNREDGPRPAAAGPEHTPPQV